MEKKIAKKILEKFSVFSKKEKVSFFVVGSLGYRNAIEKQSKMELCDDIDCIFVYNNIDSLEKFEYLSPSFLNEAKKLILNDKIDMFSNKFYIENVQISADYISKEYLERLAAEKIENVNKFRRKLTDSIEKLENRYCNIYGEKVTYTKSYEVLDDYRIYKLPIHLFINKIFYPGVLLNKFIYNPVCLVNYDNIRDLVQSITKNIELYCKQIGNGACIYNTFYRKEDLSREEKMNLGWRE